MRNRAMSADGDYVFGPGSFFYVNNPQAVAQAIKTRLRLLTEEWFLDKAEGLDASQILGNRTQGTRDQQVQARIIGTPGVTRISEYASNVNPTTRAFTVAAIVDTIYGATAINQEL